MTIITRTLNENIAHIEDLPIGDFLDVLRNIGSMTGQEKLDGANLWVGIDNNNKFYTSLEGKRTNAERKYSASEWPEVSAYNQFKAAHAALAEVVPQIKTVLSPGDTVEVEVLFGAQPNTVQYGLNGKSFIAFLRGVAGTADDKAEKIGIVLQNREVQVSVELVSTTDGKELSNENQSVSFKFVTPQKIDSAELDTSSVKNDLAKLEDFLNAPSEVQGKTNLELLNVKLGSININLRPTIKDARDNLIAKIQTDFKTPIKNALLTNVVRKLKSKFSVSGLSDDKDMGIEGVVLRNPDNGQQVKIVDKDIFTTINKFNQAVRGQIQSSLMTTDPEAPLEARGGLVGELRIKIAELLGNRELAKNANARKILSTMKGTSPEDSIKNLAKSMPELTDYQAIKRKVLALVQHTYKELNTKLDEFNKQKDDYELKLKNGKTIGLSDETVNKTLLSFAEARRNTTNLFEKIKATSKLEQLLAILYGAAARTVHETLDVQESLMEKAVSTRKWKAPVVKKITIKSSKIKVPKIKKTIVAAETGLSNFENKDTLSFVSSYLATMCMSMILLQEKDRFAINKLRDRKGSTLKSWSIEMSPLNFWGYGIWQPQRADVKAHMLKRTQTDLLKLRERIPAQWWRSMHMDFSFDNQVKIDWVNHERTLTRLIEITGVRNERLNSLLYNSVRWKELSYDEQIKTINKLFILAQQYITKSSLFIRIRKLQNNMLLNATGKNPLMVESKLLKQISLMSEADSSSVGSDVSSADTTSSSSNDTTNISPTQNAVTAGDANPSPVKTTRMIKRNIVKRKRNPAVKSIAMKFPDPRKKNETH